MRQRSFDGQAKPGLQQVLACAGSRAPAHRLPLFQGTFASHLDPAELVVIMNESGKDGWELVTVVAVTDYHPLTLIQPEIEVQPEEAEEVVQLEAFRYIFKRPAA